MRNIHLGDCLDVMKKIQDKSIDMIYLDPPFFTNKKHTLSPRSRILNYSFDDLWGSHREYAEFMHARLSQAHRLLKDTGTLFIHCDRSANHILRFVAEDVFGCENFISEIIWSYKRWSNSAKNLIPNHQNILFFSKTDQYTFNKILCKYSETTNVDQILQKRARDDSNKSIYARAEDGSIIGADEKKGVPLSDVWEIPFLNPKAKERTGYPTQKPILLLERIIELSTNTGDVVLDPFCGSGTTLVAAKILGRNFVGIDSSEDAIKLASHRLNNIIKTESALLKNGRSSYLNADEKSLSIISGLDCIPVQRNAGMDALLKKNYLSKPVPVRVQRENESIFDAASKLSAAARKKGALLAFLVVTNEDEDLAGCQISDELIKFVKSTALNIKNIIESHIIDLTDVKCQSQGLNFHF